MMKLSSFTMGTFARFPSLPAVAAMSAAAFAVMFTACSASAAEPELPQAPAPAPAAYDAPAQADKLGKDGESRLAAHASAVGKANPGFIELMAGGYYRHVISTDPSIVGKDSETQYIQAGGGFGVSSGYFKPQAHFEIKPMKMLTLRAEYDFFAYGGQQRSLVAFPSKNADFGESALHNATEETGTGHKAMLQSRSNVKLGPVYLKNKTEIAYYYMTGNDQGQYMYEVEHDTLVKKGDVVFNAKTEVFFKPWTGTGDAGLFLGPTIEGQHAFRTNLSRTRVGGGIAFTPVHQVGWMVRPTIQIDGGVNASDPNRQGEPFGTFAFSTEFQ
jgi:hypothetical protein